MAIPKGFFAPSSVAVIGASRHKGKVGYEILRALSGFRGKVYPINPSARRIAGLKVYPSVLDVPDKIDLAIIAVRAPIVPVVLQECVQKGIPAVVIISGGFKEIGAAGAALEEKCAQIIAGSATRVIGPNCIGVFNPTAKLDMLFLSPDRLARPKAGKIAFISQSGAVGSAVLDWLAAEGIGLSKFVSYGNAMDIDESDLIEYLAADPDTAVITMYLEGVKDGRKFLRVAKACKKPIIVLKAGKSARGVAAVASHTGSLAGEAAVYSGAFRQAGIIEAADFEQLFDYAKALAMQPRATGQKILIVTDGGGYGVLATDEAEKVGLNLARPSSAAVAALRKALPPHAILHNPVDVTGDTNAERYKLVLNRLLPEYDGAIVITLFQVPLLEPKVVDVIAAAQKFRKPLVACATGGPYTKKLACALESKGVPVYPTPERAVRAMGVLCSSKQKL